jgi:hypothetical protein
MAAGDQDFGHAVSAGPISTNLSLLLWDAACDRQSAQHGLSNILIQMM